MKKPKPTVQSRQLDRISEALKKLDKACKSCRANLETLTLSRDAASDCQQAQVLLVAAELALSDAIAMLTAAEMAKDNLMLYREAAMLAEIQLCYV